MNLGGWLCCPECGPETRVEIVRLEETGVGVRCMACNRKIEAPVERVEPNYRTVMRAEG